VVQKALSGKELSKKDPDKANNNSELTEATQDTHNGLNRQRKGKHSKFPKLNENDIIMNSHNISNGANDSSNRVMY
jgi:hypothetical protein